jgi:hypothetical protein
MRSVQMQLRFLGAGFACAAVLLAGGCKTNEIKGKEAIARFQQAVSGEWVNARGAYLGIVPVRSRMVTDESIYVEMTDEQGTVGWLVALDWSPKKKVILQRALTFTQDGQWRNLRQNPELFTALLPKDVKPAGTCDIKSAEDSNSVTYSCSGSSPETFRRKP